MTLTLEASNLFEVDNARNLTLKQLVDTFIETRAFKRLLSTKNHVVLGSRGSGKTALAKMLSHDHLTTYWQRSSQENVKKLSFIGIYVPTRLEWVSGLRNKPWRNLREAEEFFQWRFNVATCVAFLNTMKSCLRTYCLDEIDAARLERTFVQSIYGDWFEESTNMKALCQLIDHIKDIDFKKQQQENHKRITGKLRPGETPVGLVFDLPLYTPLRRGIEIAERYLPLPQNVSWLLVLDEAEFLQTEFLRIVNSYLRSYSGNLFFKITTMPYTHTLETNTEAVLDEGHDFEYIYIDQGPDGLFGTTDEDDPLFAEQVFKKRAHASGATYERLDLDRLLGNSILLDRKLSVWEWDGQEMEWLRKYANRPTRERAERLLKEEAKKFPDEISRKMHGALLLRNAVENLEGAKKLDIYSGKTLLVKCSDSNPRRLIRLFNRMITALPIGRTTGQTSLEDETEGPLVSRTAQTDILLAFAASVIRRVQSEEHCGPQLYEFILAIGNYMKRRFHSTLLSTDQVSSLVFDHSVPRQLWPLLERAVGLGLLYPNINPNQPDWLPKGDGTFHLAYVLAPHFRILPRRGTAHNLSTMLTKTQITKLTENVEQFQLFEWTDSKVI